MHVWLERAESGVQARWASTATLKVVGWGCALLNGWGGNTRLPWDSIWFWLCLPPVQSVEQGGTKSRPDAGGLVCAATEQCSATHHTYPWLWFRSSMA